MNNIQYLIKVLNKKRAYAALVILVMLLNSAAECLSISLIFPIAQAVLYGKAGGKYAKILSSMQEYTGIKLFLPFICLLFLLAILSKVSIGLINHYMSKKLALQMRFMWMNAIFEKYIHSKIANIINHKQGELIHNIINETNRGSICLAQSAQYVTRLCVTVAILIMLFATAPKITLLVSLAAGITTFIMLSLKSYAGKVGIKRQKLLREITESASEGIGGIRQIKTLGIESWINQHFSVKSNKLFKTELNFETLRIIPAQLIELMVAIIIVILLLYIYFFTTTDIKSIIPTLALTGFAGMKILGNTAKLSSLHWQIIALMPALKSISDVLSSEIEEDIKPKGTPIERISTDIILQDITFSYAPNDPPVLQNLNLTIHHNKLNVITAPSGTGKSTIADLIMGFYVPDAGKIMIDGEDLHSKNIKSWRNLIGYVSQEIYLFHASIKENISIGMPECNDAEIINAAKQAHAHQFITSFPEGYNTIVGDRGVTISGGQRQRIAIARTLIRHPQLMIFDEPTSALDPESEKQILSLLKELSKNKTVIVITHSPKILAAADHIHEILQ